VAPAAASHSRANYPNASPVRPTRARSRVRCISIATSRSSLDWFRDSSETAPPRRAGSRLRRFPQEMRPRTTGGAVTWSCSSGFGAAWRCRRERWRYTIVCGKQRWTSSGLSTRGNRCRCLGYGRSSRASRLQHIVTEESKHRVGDEFTVHQGCPMSDTILR
jgi:hypothetical protein